MTRRVYVSEIEGGNVRGNGGIGCRNMAWRGVKIALAG